MKPEDEKKAGVSTPEEQISASEDDGLAHSEKCRGVLV
jgi:hypothetical protein